MAMMRQVTKSKHKIKSRVQTSIERFLGTRQTNYKSHIQEDSPFTTNPKSQVITSIKEKGLTRLVTNREAKELSTCTPVIRRRTTGVIQGPQGGLKAARVNGWPTIHESHTPVPVTLEVLTQRKTPSSLNIHILTAAPQERRIWYRMTLKDKATHSKACQELVFLHSEVVRPQTPLRIRGGGWDLENQYPVEMTTQKDSTSPLLSFTSGKPNKKRVKYNQLHGGNYRTHQWPHVPQPMEYYIGYTA